MTEIRKYTIAVVDDDVRVLESMQDLLESAGYSASLFSSPEAFFEGDALSDIECLIADIGLPVIDGFELCRRVRSQRVDLPVIFITGRPEQTTQSRAEAEGHQGLFRKPFDAAALLAAVDQAVANRTGG